MQLAARKAEEPGDDIVSTLIDADADGQLTEAEFGMFVVTLTVAGNETTRNSITQGMMAFTDYPDQWELFKAQRPKTAADEIIRWASPITAFQRTALVDTELGGVQIKKGQRLVLFYRSANFDEEVFDDPFTFDILRRPQPAPGLRRHRRALLRRRQPRADDDRPDVQRDRRPHPRPDARLRARAAAVEHDQRHQALAGRLRHRRASPRLLRDRDVGPELDLSAVSSVRNADLVRPGPAPHAPTARRRPL